MHRAIVACIVLAGGLVLGGARSAAAPILGEGALDPTFGTGGTVTTDVGGLHASDGYATALQSDGKIVVVGRASMPAGGYGLAVVRYNPDGSLDTGFGSGGIVTTQVGGSAIAYAVALQPDGKIVVAGASYPAQVFDPTVVLARYTAAGALDTGFGSGGIVTTDIKDYSPDQGVAVALQPDGKIIAAGDAGLDSDNSSFALTRYTPDGALDTSFGTGGTVVTAIGSNALVYGMALQPDGKIVLAGKAVSVVGGSAATAFALARYTPAGQLDTGFGTGGVVTTPFDSKFAGGRPSGAEAYAVALQPDGKIVAAGDRFVDFGEDGEGQYFALARYTPAGELDTGFGTGGTVTTAVSGSLGAASARAVAIEPGGNIVVAGADYDFLAFTLARYTTSGDLDTHFGGPNQQFQSPPGIVVTDISNTNSEAGVYGVALQPDGKIVAAGDATIDGQNQFALARYIGDTIGPTNAHPVGLRRYSTTLTPTIRWSATDADTGVRSYDLRYRYAGPHARTYGSYHIWQTQTPVTRAVFRGVAGRTYCFQVRAYDNVGNAGAWGRPACTAFPVNGRTLKASGPWTNLSSTAYYLGAARRSTHSGASLRLAAHYRHLAIVASTGPDAGTVKIYLGSTLLKRVNLAARTAHHKVVIAVAAPKTVKSGTVRIVHGSGRKPVVIEGLAVSLA
jgi:uncharacterized delta-60 repeat protein